MNKKEVLEKLELVLRANTRVYERAIEKESNDVKRLIMMSEIAKIGELYKYIKENLK